MQDLLHVQQFPSIRKTDGSRSELDLGFGALVFSAMSVGLTYPRKPSLRLVCMSCDGRKKLSKCLIKCKLNCLALSVVISEAIPGLLLVLFLYYYFFFIY